VRGKALAARPDGDLYVAALRELYGLDAGGSPGGAPDDRAVPRSTGPGSPVDGDEDAGG